MGGEKKLSMKSLYQEILTLKEHVKEIEPLKLKVIQLQETVKNLKNNRNNKKDNEETPAEKEKTCVKCEIVFDSKNKLNKHKIEAHSQQINCQYCDKVFKKNCDLEVHIKSQHETVKDYKCDLCDKSFVLRWRMLKHQESHRDHKRKKCHYFNNIKHAHLTKSGACLPIQNLKCVNSTKFVVTSCAHFSTLSMSKKTKIVMTYMKK